MPVSKRILVASVLVALTAPTLVWADYRAYARGQEAAADGNWSEVEQEMQQALSANPAPKVRVKLYGQRFAPYVPQYYLGLAAYRQNDCATALRWFGDVVAAPVIAQVAEFRGVADAARTDCTAKLAANKPAADPSATDKPKPPPATPEKPVPDKPVVDKPVVQTPPPVTNKPTPPVVSPDKPATTPTSPAPPVPAALQTAVQQWLAGRYREAVSGNVNGLQGKALAHLHLLRASAYFAQSEIAPADAVALRASAAQEVRNARRAQPAIVPDAGFHSPRFRAFFAATR